MRVPAVTVEALPAGYGDSVLVKCALGTGVWRLLVDTGPDECWSTLQQRLAQIPVDRDGRRYIDLAVISHIDHDHIGAARALFDDRSLGLTFGDIWFNAPPRPASRGVAAGQSLAALLGAEHTDLPWNKAWGGQAAVTAAEAPFIELPSAKGKPRLTLLSPTPATLANLFKVWEKELCKLGQSEAPEPARPVSRGALDLEELAAKATAKDHAPANGSSIAFPLEHEGASVLLGSDAYAPVLVESLQTLATHRAVSLPWQVDVFKLSHHGSRANITVDPFGAVQAKHYIVSTNGAIFGHPDDEAIARAIVNGGTQRKLWFNYRNEHTAKWDAPELRERYRYSVGLPADGQQGTTIALGKSPAGD